MKNWIRRQYHLLFEKNRCIKIKFQDTCLFKPRDIILQDNGTKLLCLGNDWYLFLKKK